MSLNSVTPRQAATVVLLVLISSVAVWMWWKPATQPPADEGQKVVEAFLTLIREGQADQAWMSTTAEFKSARGQEAFVRDTKKLAFLKEPLQFFAVNTVTVQDQPRSEYLFRAADGNSKTNLRVVLGREGGEWKVDLWVPPTAP